MGREHHSPNGVAEGEKARSQERGHREQNTSTRSYGQANKMGDDQPNKRDGSAPGDARADTEGSRAQPQGSNPGDGDPLGVGAGLTCDQRLHTGGIDSVPSQVQTRQTGQRAQAALRRKRRRSTSPSPATASQ